MFIVKAQKIETVHPKAYHDGISKGYIKLVNNPIPEQKIILQEKGKSNTGAKKKFLAGKGHFKQGNGVLGHESTLSIRLEVHGRTIYKT